MSRRKPAILVAGLVIGACGVAWANWPKPAFAFPTVASGELDGMTGTADDNYRLRLHLSARRFSGTTMKPWTELDEPARSLWPVLCFENVAAYGGKLSDYRLQLNQDPTLPSFDAVAEAYRALGATKLAVWLGQAVRSKGPAWERVPEDLLKEGRAVWVDCVHRHAAQIVGVPP